MIEQIIDMSARDKFIQKYCVDRPGQKIRWIRSVFMTDTDMIEAILEALDEAEKTSFSPYNKQLLDGVEGDIREMPTKTIHETLDYVNKEATLLAVNKYRV